VTVLNLMSAPGAGKTSLLERVLSRPPAGVRIGVLEGDVQGSYDADRVAALHVPVVQVNTDGGFGGECHLDANMVRSALPALALEEIDLVADAAHNGHRLVLARLKVIRPIRSHTGFRPQ